MTIARSQTLRIALLLFILETLSLCCVGLAFGPNVGPTGLANGFSNVNLNQPFQRVGGASNLQTARLTPSFPETTPLQRVLLHSKGTIQTFFSSYYNATTNICIDSEAWVESEGGVNREFPFVVNRRVTQSIVVGDGGERAGKLVPYCIATSTIKVGDVDVYKNKGLAQMFNNKITRFELKDWGVDSEGKLWRNYMIGGENVEAEVREEFVKDCFELLDHI